MADESTCVICKKKTTENLILFSEDTFKKCKTILKQRKIHNLKYKDIVLPVEEIGSGYHRECYKSFTALGKKYFTSKSTSAAESISGQKLTSPSTDQQSPRTELSSIHELTPIPQSIEPQSSTQEKTDVLKSGSVSENVDSDMEIDIPTESDTSIDDHSPVCLFCGKKCKKKRSNMQPLHEADKEKLESYLIRTLKDQEEYHDLLSRLANADSPKIHYHNICKLDLFNKVSTLSKETVKSTWHFHREYHQMVFDEIRAMIEENVIEKGRCYFLTYLHRYYMDLLERIAEENSEEIDVTFTHKQLEDKITKAFRREIKFLTKHRKKLVVPKNLTDIDDELFENLKEEDILQTAALILRKSILLMEKEKTPENIQTQNAIEEEVSLPEKLLDFHGTVFRDCSWNQKNSAECTNRVRFHCEDIVYAVHNGKIKTSKHIMLGMTLKSLNSSREVIDIVNRYGHCISYQEIEELEAKGTSSSILEDSLCLETIQESPNSCAKVACNSDQLVGARNSEDILHDTAEITNQKENINDGDKSAISEAPLQNDEETSGKEKRRKLDTGE